MREELSEDKERKAEKYTPPEGEVVYRAVRQNGDSALRLRSSLLAWSGFAAGISMGFSLVAEGALRAHLPEASWTPLVTKLGYPIGFLIVILGRQQLFTEQTLTAVLPLLSKDRPQGVLSNVARMWAIVLSANLVGSAVFALATAGTPAFPAEMLAEFSRIGHEALQHGFVAALVKGIYAGFLVATMVWLLPAAGQARFWIIVALTYVIGIGGLTHIIAGSAECLFVVFRAERSFLDYAVNFLIPVLLGNSIGGVVLVAALAHAQHAPDESRE